MATVVAEYEANIPQPHFDLAMAVVAMHLAMRRVAVADIVARIVAVVDVAAVMQSTVDALHECAHSHSHDQANAMPNAAMHLWSPVAAVEVIAAVAIAMVVHRSMRQDSQQSTMHS